MSLNYRIGLDIGIGSVGWAVIAKDADSNNAHIEDASVRIFESGEQNNGRDRKSQERRGYRGPRRTVNRKAFRKHRLKNYLKEIGLIDDEILENLAANNNQIIELKVKALDSKISEEEIVRCLIHSCNHRGYQSFYDENNNTKTDEEDAKKIQSGLDNFSDLMTKNAARSVSECFLKSSVDPVIGKPAFRNTFGRMEEDQYYLFSRDNCEKEVELILSSQRLFYPQLTEEAIDKIEEIIFAQRDFEDGPGDANDPHRRYSGFADDIGVCSFYPNERRGFRASPIGDLFAVVNVLSQMSVINKRTGENGITAEIAEEILEDVLIKATFNKRMVKSCLKNHGFERLNAQNLDNKLFENSIKFLNSIKKAIADDTLWEILVKEDQLNIYKHSRLFEISEILALNITPKRRVKALDKFIAKNKCFGRARSNLSQLKAGGTANASNKYMCEAINAAKNGQMYGDFQYSFIQRSAQNKGLKKQKIDARILQNDEAINNNPVVYRAINETRKIVNNIIDRYGTPECINIEVARDMNKGYETRMKEKRENENRNKENEKCIKEIKEILQTDIVSAKVLQKYKLYREQHGKSPYSGKDLGTIEQVLDDVNDHKYEIDHIIPDSLILDNSLNNKVLVFGSENQQKKQRTPLEYIQNKKQRDNFLSMINGMYSRQESPISKKKYRYLTVDFTDAVQKEEILDGWKTRNINDTRYITKYIVNLLSKSLKFTGTTKQPVFAIKGFLTSNFRRVWLSRDGWGSEEKNRNNYFNHAVDAVVIANLTPAWVEVSSACFKLKSMLKHKDGDTQAEIDTYKDSICKRMMENYGWDKAYTEEIISRNLYWIPSYIKNLNKEVDARFEIDPEKFKVKTQEVYSGRNIEWVVEPHVLIFSIKPSRRCRGKITDANPIRLEEIDGVLKKVVRKSIKKLTVMDLEYLRTNDSNLRRQLTEILNGQPKTYSVGDYLVANNLSQFFTAKGQKVHKVSLVEKNGETYIEQNDRIIKLFPTEINQVKKSDLANVYIGCDSKKIGVEKKEIEELNQDLANTLDEIFKDEKENYSVKRYLSKNKLSEFKTKGEYTVGSLYLKSEKNSNILKKEISKDTFSYLSVKYYCLGVYQNRKGDLATFGIRYVDLFKTQSKLYLDRKALPTDFQRMICYLMPNDYIKIINKNGKIKFEGYYQSICNAYKNQIYGQPINQVKGVNGRKPYYQINGSDQIEHCEVTILGQKIEGKKKCSEPLSLMMESM